MSAASGMTSRRAVAAAALARAARRHAAARSRRERTRPGASCAGFPRVDLVRPGRAGASPCVADASDGLRLSAPRRSRSRPAASGSSTWAAGSRRAAACCSSTLPAGGRAAAGRHDRARRQARPAARPRARPRRQGLRRRGRAASGARRSRCRVVAPRPCRPACPPTARIRSRRSPSAPAAGSSSTSARAATPAAMRRRRAAYAVPRRRRRQAARRGLRGDARRRRLRAAVVQAVRDRPAQLARARLGRGARRAAAGRELDRLPRRGRAARRAQPRASPARNYGWPYCVGAQPGRARLRRPLRLREERGAGAALAGARRAAADARRAGRRRRTRSPASSLVAWHGYRAGGHRVVSFMLDASGRPSGAAARLDRRLGGAAARRPPARHAGRHPRRFGRRACSSSRTATDRSSCSCASRPPTPAPRQSADAFASTFSPPKARRAAAACSLRHGVVETPVFMPVGTYGSVKGVTAVVARGDGRRDHPRQHLPPLAAPGHRRASRSFGGLHRFEGWTRPILTDSGGFQVWSLGANAKVSEQGVAFQSPVNGDKLLLTPEVSMQIQRVLDSDIAMQFDECTAYEVEGRITGEAEARRSMEMSLRWAAALAGRVRAAREPERAVRHRPGRHVRGAARGVGRRRWPSSTCPATRSAASASASRRRRCSASSPTRRIACRRASRAT